MRILLTGATGFIGSGLCELLVKHGHTLWALSRNPHTVKTKCPSVERAFAWNPEQEAAPAGAFEGVNGVIHLAGAQVSGRWSAAKKQAILDSRVLGTRNLVEGMRGLSERPQVLVSASAVGYYGNHGEEELSEDSPPGDDFLADVCGRWEAEAAKAEDLGVRVVRIRTGLVLGKGGGPLQEMLMLFKLGLGGPLGSGRQWWSWVHLDDVLELYRFAVEHEVSGPLNGVAPQPVRQKEFARALGKALCRPAFLPAPAWLLELALGEFSGALLRSLRVYPKKTLATGFTFRYPDLEGALEYFIR